MTRRLPILATLVVGAAVALMVALGIWQLQRAKWKDTLLAQYGEAQKLPPMAWPSKINRDEPLPLFRSATGVCLRATGARVMAGQSKTGEPGYVHIIDCASAAGGQGMSVEIGWSKNPNARIMWPGGPVSGIIAPDRRTGIRLVADGAAPGLQPSALPSPTTIPNNHRSYAVQWFSFAAIALAIYGLALRKRWKEDRAT